MDPVGPAYQLGVLDIPFGRGDLLRLCGGFCPHSTPTGIMDPYSHANRHCLTGPDSVHYTHAYAASYRDSLSDSGRPNHLTNSLSYCHPGADSHGNPITNSNAASYQYSDSKPFSESFQFCLSGPDQVSVFLGPADRAICDYDRARHPLLEIYRCQLG